MKKRTTIILPSAVMVDSPSQKIRKGSTRLIPWAVPNSINRFNSTNKLTIEKKGSELLFLINDNFVGKIAFEPFFGNSIGFTVWNKQTIIFDDLVITQGK